MTKYYYFIGFCFLMVIMSFIVPTNDDQKKTVSEILISKGMSFEDKLPNFNIEGVSAEVGETLFKTGFAPKPNGGKSKRQSKHFVCTSCHNTVKEDPNLTVSDPQKRLEYAVKNDLPFLQGTTMYGAVNRETYYNGDYDKKYGDLVLPARKNIRNAIQLCAKECAQGRTLKDWELESILAYLWTLELEVGDLDMDVVEIEKLTVEEIQNEYLSGSPATFIPPPTDRKAGNDLKGDIPNGEEIYDRSCLHCHYKGQYSFFHLDKSKLSLKHLSKNIGKYSRHSLYQVVRWGVPTKSGKRSYMPQYTEERLSRQQMADLRAYIENGAD